ncbi:MAG: type II toxin-antitoxin system prevent-host-death family antitoxin [Bacilli bacterium]|nr:type II toxin-antitoxin system prevent-host-death family antitoxin [Bacilli bacterium]
MCRVTATELKNNLSYYLEKSKEEDVYITKNNKVISKLVNPQLDALNKLMEIIKTTNFDQNIEMDDHDIIVEAIENR